MWEKIKELFRNALSFIKNIVITIIRGVLNFTQQVINYFKNLNLDQRKHIPFIANKSYFKDQVKNAPVVDCGIFQGVYNEVIDDFEHVNEIKADSLDEQTKNILGKQELVVLN